MAIASIRFNQEEEKVLYYLKDHLHYDTSALLKKALYELYEDIKDKEIIEEIEDRSKKSTLKFYSIDELFE